MSAAEQKGLQMLYFVLKPRKTDPHGLAARVAIRVYAAEIRTHNPVLANDLEAWMNDLDNPGKD
jgi:hypothetical protein